MPNEGKRRQAYRQALSEDFPQAGNRYQAHVQWYHPALLLHHSFVLYWPLFGALWDRFQTFTLLAFASATLGTWVTATEMQSAECPE
jgi:hypothetical protein